MLSDVYFDTTASLKEGLFYFQHPQAEAFSYPENLKTRLESLIGILSMETKFHDCLGLDGDLAMKEAQREQMEEYNALLEALKLKSD